MYIRRLGFTLVEIMIVISIIAILGTVTFFGTQPYMSRSRDTNRISDMRSLATNIGAYKQANNQEFPENATGATYEYCLSRMALWPNQSDADKKYNDLLNNIKIIPRSTNTLVGVLPCDDPTSFFYNRLEDATGNQYAILAVHMETDEDVTYFTGADLLDPSKIIDLMDNTKMKGLDITTLAPGQTPLHHILIN